MGGEGCKGDANPSVDAGFHEGDRENLLEHAMEEEKGVGGVRRGGAWQDALICICTQTSTHTHECLLSQEVSARCKRESEREGERVYRERVCVNGNFPNGGSRASVRDRAF